MRPSDTSDKVVIEFIGYNDDHKELNLNAQGRCDDNMCYCAVCKYFTQHLQGLHSLQRDPCTTVLHNECLIGDFECT